MSPTAYFLLLLLTSEFRINLPKTLAAPLMVLIPVAALLICEWIVWSGSNTVGRKIGWSLLTLLAMLVQFGVIQVMLRAILRARIAYAP
ncbi:MAG: hypothetical protein AB7U20_16420 [Planctomycetaceae bacterium]